MQPLGEVEFLTCTAMIFKKYFTRPVLSFILAVEMTAVGYILRRLSAPILERYHFLFVVAAVALIGLFIDCLLAVRPRESSIVSDGRRSEAERALANRVAHGFNDMLTGVLGFCDELRGEENLSPHHQVDIEQIIEIAQRGSLLTKQLLAMKDPAPAPATSPNISARGSETILVDDEDIVRRVVSRGLIKSGYHVLEAEDGESALKISATSSRPINLLLTDVSMRGINGHQLAELFLASHPEMKILLMSGYPEHTFAPLPGPGTAFIEKTFSIDELNKTVRRLLDEPFPSELSRP